MTWRSILVQARWFHDRRSHTCNTQRNGDTDARIHCSRTEASKENTALLTRCTGGEVEGSHTTAWPPRVSPCLARFTGNQTHLGGTTIIFHHFHVPSCVHGIPMYKCMTHWHASCVSMFQLIYLNHENNTNHVVPLYYVVYTHTA